MDTPVTDTTADTEVTEPTAAPEVAPSTPEQPAVDPAKAAADQAAADTKAKAERHAKTIAETLKAQRQVQKDREQLQAANAKIQEKYERVEAQAKQLEEYRGQLVGLIQGIKQDPVKFLQDLGIGPNEYFERTQRGGKPGPEEAMQDELKKAYAEINQLKSRWSKYDEDQAKQAEMAKQRAEQHAQQQAAQAVEQAREDFWQEIQKNKDVYPDVAIYDRDSIVQGAILLVQQLGDEADDLSYPELAKRLQDSTRAWHQKIKGPSEQVAPPVDAAPPQALAVPGKKDPGPVVQKIRRGSGRGATEQTLSSNLNGRASAKGGTFDLETEKRAVAEALKRAGVVAED